MKFHTRFQDFRPHLPENYINYQRACCPSEAAFVRRCLGKSIEPGFSKGEQTGDYSIMFNSLFLTALIIFLLGLIYKVSNWFVKKIAAPGQTITTFQRMRSAAGGILSVVFSPKLLIVLKVILVDVLLQGRVFNEDVTRWLAHMLHFLRVHAAAVNACAGFSGHRSAVQ
jgi:hypothetical protein